MKYFIEEQNVRFFWGGGGVGVGWALRKKVYLGEIRHIVQYSQTKHSTFPTPLTMCGNVVSIKTVERKYFKELVAKVLFFQTDFWEQKIWNFFRLKISLCAFITRYQFQKHLLRFESKDLIRL